MYALRIGAFVVASVGLHLLLYGGLERMPARHADRPTIVQVAVVEPPAPPPPEPPPPEPAVPPVPDELTPQPPPPERPTATPPPERPPRPRPRTVEPPPSPTLAKDVPPSERAPTVGPTSDEPVFGVSMESTAPAGGGPAVPVGNTLQTGSDGSAMDPKKVKPLAPASPPPVPAHEVERAPELKDRELCRGRYTDQARDAGVEGTVVLDLVVGEDGKARDIKVVKGLGHGLDGAAVDAVARCPFAPGLRGGKPVPVRIRGFKVSFVLRSDD